MLLLNKTSKEKLFIQLRERERLRRKSRGVDVNTSSFQKLRNKKHVKSRLLQDTRQYRSGSLALILRYS